MTPERLEAAVRGYRRTRATIWIYPLVFGVVVYARTSSMLYAAIAFLLIALWASYIVRLLHRACSQLRDRLPDDPFGTTTTV